jgi:hypothetical protein
MTFEERETPAYTIVDGDYCADHIYYIQASEEVVDYS